MSELKLISPLLDGFAMGPPISSHQGVRCCPAMKRDSDNKYIVKIISVPASPSQLDALLIAGAYRDQAEVAEHFRSLAESLAEEADVLRKVSDLEGFLPYDGHQIVPMEDGKTGYLIYLISPYKRSLEKCMRRIPEAIRKDAVKLGIDLCRALSACRQQGFLYTSLKPTNVFLCDDKVYRIGDLGFVPLDSVMYASLPSRSRSPYCPPEVLDPTMPLNGTLDTYALGMILYQVCNDGKLPDASHEPGLPFPSPVHGDEKLVSIIMKAIAPDPKDRWADPSEMGNALAACIPEDAVRPYVPAAARSTLTDSATHVFSTAAVAAAIESGKNTVASMSDTRILSRDAVKEASSQTRVFSTQEVMEAMSASTQPGLSSQDTRPMQFIDHQPDAASSAALSQETRVMSPVATTPVAVTESASVAPSYMEYDDEDDEDDYDDDNDVVRSIPVQKTRVKKSGSKAWIVWLIVLALLGGIGYGAYYYYTNYYLQTIDSMVINGFHDQLTVTVVTDIDEQLLSISCTDTYGNSTKRKLTGGKAEFTDLLPNSQYKLSLEIEGFHQLVGKTSDVFNTESRTEIISFTGVAGSEDGSVMLNFTVDGPEPDAWILTYWADGEDPLTEEFTGHAITVRDLAFPKLYTFQLSPSEDIYLIGQTTMEFSSTALVLAKDLTITACDNNEMTVRWDLPAGVEVESWTVRCYSDGGYDQTLETTDNKAVFQQIDPGYVHYVEVTAKGMTQCVRTSITADPITITSLKVDESDSSKLTVTWDHSGEAPDGGWLLMYSLDGTNTQSVVKCSGPSAEISPRIHGAEYRFIIQAADSTSIFGNHHTYLCPEPEAYREHSFEPDKTTAYLLVTPDKKNWTNSDVSKDDYRDSFQIGEKISILLFCDSRFYIPSEELSILYVIRNEEGQVISNLVSRQANDWHDLWVAHNTSYGELDLTTIPTEVGKYTISIYFNDLFIASAAFSITE